MSGGVIINNSPKLIKSFVFYFILTLLAQRIFFKVGGSVLPLYFLYSIVFVTQILLSFRLPYNKSFLSLYIMFFILALYAVLGAIYEPNLAYLAQLIPFTLMPISFIWAGYFIPVTAIVRVAIMGISGVSLFTLAQFLYFSFSFEGPFGVFKLIKDYDLSLQLDLLGHNVFSRPTGLFLDANILGFFSGIIFFMFLYLSRYESKKITYSGMLLSLFCLVMSISRGSLVAFIIAVTILTLINIVKLLLGYTYNKQLLVIVLMFYSCIFMFFATINLDQFDRALEIIEVVEKGSAVSANLSGRMDAWNNILTFVMQHPLGTFVPPQKVISDSPDNQFINFAAQGGFILAVIYILFWLYLLLCSIINKDPDRDIIFASCIFFVTNSQTALVFNSFAAFIFWLLLGIALKNKSLFSNSSIECARFPELT